VKNRVCPGNFHCIEITVLEELALALKTEVFLKYFIVLNIVFTFRIFEQLVLALKKRVCTEFTVLNVDFFIIQNFKQPSLALKNIICPEIFAVLKYFSSSNIFEQLELALQTEFALNFSSRRAPAPRLVRHWVAVNRW